LFPIVGIGASAGGLEAASSLLRHLPSDTGFAYVLVQHLDPDHESALTQLLARVATLPVLEVTADLPVERNQVYVIQPNTNLQIKGGVLRVRPRERVPPVYHPIDTFLESLAEDRRDRAIGIILSGTATDGTLGLEAIKAAGGITFAQDESAKYDSMPKSAVASGSVDFVLSPQAIAHELTRIAKHPFLVDSDKADLPVRASDGDTQDKEPAEAGDAGTSPGGGLKEILALLRDHSRVDFSLYKSTTIERRIARRMAVNSLGTSTEYLDFLRGNTRELNALYGDTLIGVTGFFRNAEAFGSLGRKVVDSLLSRGGDEPIRVWVLGCSTGQEAYSIAMLFAEAAEKIRSSRKLQVFATDVCEPFLDVARRGFYTKHVMLDLTPERIRRFFVEESGGYRVNKSLREMILFARHDLISDPPFSRMDLISCRNLLIYLEPSLQRKAIPTFHYALRSEGFLFLGASESIGNFTELFAPVDKAHRIYSKRAVSMRTVPLPIRGPQEQRTGHPRWEDTSEPGAQTGKPEALPDESTAVQEADRIAVSRFAPPGVIINADLQIVQFRGNTGAYLQPPTGKASFDLLKMAREGLMLPLRAVVYSAMKEGKVSRRENVRLRQADGVREITIEVIPLRNLKERSFLVIFQESAAGSSTDSRSASAVAGSVEANAESARRITELETELRDTREYLQSVQERQEAANEELQASNEEVQSANEELQSINEELETSKEELESTNEELTTINEEMTTRNAELARLNSDLINVQTSTRVPIVMLGRDLTIHSFSGAAEKQFSLQAADVGRPFGQIRHNLVIESMQESAAALDSLINDVIASARERELEVRDVDRRWYSLRVRPYMTVDNRVDGAVLVLVDIDDLKRAQQSVAAGRDYAEAVIRTARDPLVILDADLRVHTANDAFYRTFGYKPKETLGRLIYQLGNHEWEISRLRQLLEDILPRKSQFNDFEVQIELQHAGQRTMLLNARQMDLEGQPERILLGIQDVSEVLVLQNAAREEAEKFKIIFNRSALPKWTVDPQTLRFLMVNDTAVEHYGYSHRQFEQMKLSDLLVSDGDAASKASANSPSVAPGKQTMRHRKASGAIIDVETLTNEISMGGKKVWLTSVNDITELHRAEQALQTTNEQLTSELAATRQLQQMSAQLIHEDQPDALYQQILNSAVTIMHADMASIQVVDEDRNVMQLLARKGIDPELSPTFENGESDSDTPYRAAWNERRRVVVPDVETTALTAGRPITEDFLKVGIRAVQCTPLISRPGRIIGILSTYWRSPYQPPESGLRMLDILARQAADLMERKIAEERLKDADRRKNEFLAVLAHELRTPLSPIRNALEIIRMTRDVKDDIQSAASVIDRQVRQMVRLVDDLLDVSRISRGKIELRVERIALTAVLAQAVESARPNFESRGVQLNVIPPQEETWFSADPARLAQAVANLLNNAAKFTDKGGHVDLTAETRNEEVLIRVKDTGIGIDASQLRHILEMFTQVDVSLERKHGGLGIGLALTRSLVELHGGELEVHSPGLGKGSEFIVRLPLNSLPQAIPPPRAEKPSTAKAERRRILVVDDNRDSADSLSALLEMTGHDTRVAHVGLDAVSMAESFLPDVILLDIGLPHLNGYDAARRIRQHSWGKEMKLVALTGWGQHEDREESKNAGFDFHLVKPVDYETIAELLTRIPAR
jgi:two-component system CheB/CheR fusion protein